MRIIAAAALVLCVTPPAQAGDADCRRGLFSKCPRDQLAAATNTPTKASAAYARAPRAGDVRLDAPAVSDTPLARAAGDFALYVEDAAALRQRGVGSAGDLDRALAVFGAYDPA
ncbi:MAG: hypothetical protein MI723_19635, partial [Caulobacterales bacterium]|nr:hypothetical protein [Caulobacterales bacterium]